VPNVVAGRFEIVDLAGAGGAATVHRAIDRKSGETVALKRLRGQPDGEAMVRFAREAHLLAQLSHPGVVRYVAHGYVEGDLYLAMEWLEGTTLLERLGKRSLTIAESVTLVHRVAEALGATHASGIVHRDIKPANIFLVHGDPTQVKLLDFGVAYLRFGWAELTQAGAVIGTPGYMAPEQARGDRAHDARADVFSLGCVLYRCLSGKPAFTGPDLVAILAKVLLEEPPPVRTLRPEVPGDLDALVARMLQKRPEDRPVDASAVAAAIASLGLAEHRDPPTVQMAPSLTTDERRMMFILLSRAAGGVSYDPETLRAAIDARGGRLEALADGSLLVTLEGIGPPIDVAARAARCALALRAQIPALPIVLAAGEGEIRARVPVGPVIDRASVLLAQADGDGGVRVDEVVAGLLDGRFDVQGDGAHSLLVGERATKGTGRTFLGRPSTFVGREPDLAMLQGIWRECMEESIAQVVLVTGPAGIGKSRVLDELLLGAGGTGERRAEVWACRGDPMRARSPFGMIGDVVRHASRIGPGEPAAERLRKLEARLGCSLAPTEAPRVTQFLAEIAAGQPLERASVELEAARRDPQLMGDQIRRAWEDWLEAETRAHPVVLVLEDLHWGDLPSVQLVDAAARHLERRSFLVLALARPDVYERFPRIWTDRNLTELRLRRLGDKAAGRLVREALGSDAPEDVVARIVERGSGNAFFLQELARAALDGKGDDPPTSLLAMVQARLASLSVEARRFLRAASVFGKVFPVDGASALVGTGESTAARHDVLGELAQKDVIRRAPGDAPDRGRLAFEHGLVQEAAYAMLTDADRALGHRLAAEWLERAGDADPVVLAEHFERGGERARAIGWYAQAAEQALGGNDHEAVMDRVERAVACGAAGVQLGVLCVFEAEARRWRGENELARKAAREAMHLLPAGSARWCGAASELAAVCGSLGDTDTLVALAGDLEGVEPLEDAASELVHALARVARPLFWAGRHALASGALARAGMLEHATGPTALAALYMARGVEARLRGDSSDCVRWNELAVAQSTRAGDLRGGCVELGNLGYAYLEIGAYAEAERALADALATATRLGLPLVVATAQQNLGLVLARRGDAEQGARLETTSAVAFERQNDLRRAGCSFLYLALIEVARDGLDAAEDAARRALEMLAQNPPLRCNALAVLAQIQLARGDEAPAIEAAAQAYELLGALGSIDEGETRVRLVHAEALRAAGLADASCAALREALDRLLARAGKIPEGPRRDAFLRAIPENARTIELARAWRVPPA
jgi:tetratricopeptide (TPR) repeat protein